MAQDQWLKWSKVTCGGGGKTKRAGVIMICNGEILVIKQNEGLWGLPKGSICFSDIDFTTACDGKNQIKVLLKAAQREFLEEVGVHVNIKDLKKFPMITVRYHRYFVALVDKKPNINIDINEISEYAWVPQDDFIRIELDHNGSKKQLYYQSKLTTEAIIKAKQMV